MPPKPAVFAPDAAPPGVEYKHVLFSRPKLKARARLILVHTNAASREGSIGSAWDWAHARPGSNTCPTYQVDRDGSARKMVASDEDAIANGTVESEIPGWTGGDVSEWSLAIETADTGTIADPSISDFTDAQVETIAKIIAYESILWGIPIEIPTVWHGAGVGAHTEPFGYPFWTTVRGKTCPGSKKKATLRARIMPRAREIVAEWTEEHEVPVSEEQYRADLAAIHTRITAVASRVSNQREILTGHGRRLNSLRRGLAAVRASLKRFSERVTAWLTKF